MFFFLVIVIIVYIVDKKFFLYVFLFKKYRLSRYKGMVVLSEGDYELVDGKANYYDEVVFKGVSEESDIKEIKEFEEYRKEYMDIFRELRKKNFNVDMKILEEMVEYEVINRGLKSRVFYRI